MNKVYVAIDLKSFYASVECAERNLNPLTTNLVVADPTRTQKTICLAVSPSLKKLGVSGRPRLFEVEQIIKKQNAIRYSRINKAFVNKSFDSIELANNQELEIDYVIAQPRMALYIEYSSKIYSIYLKKFSPDDIHVYSIDEVFIDITSYLKMYKQEPEELIRDLINEIYKATKITATAGIATNLYLAKVAMDIVAKKMPADKNGVRIAKLDEMSYRKLLWNHEPLTDFWRVGRGYAQKLQTLGIVNMGDIARMSINNEDCLYNLFGVNAELLIDHAWGYEPTTMEAIKTYKPSNNCFSSGQVLHCPYDFNKALLIVKEMTENLCLDLFAKKLVTNKVVLTIGYDVETLNQGICPEVELVVDHYGRKIPKHAHGTINLDLYTSSTKLISKQVVLLYKRIVNPRFLVRRINLTFTHLKTAETAKIGFIQLNLFDNINEKIEEMALENKNLEREKSQKEAILKIKQKYGKNAILKAINLEDGSTMKERNEQIGGHKA